MNTQKFAKIQDILTEMVETGAAAGGSCLIYKDDEEKCYYEAGYADRENKVPVKRDTIFRLYSMTKPMTAVAAMLLVQDGKLDLVEPLSTYLPFFKNPMVAENGTLRPAAREVQVRDLLNMTSGYTYDGASNETEIQTTKLLDEIKARMDGENPFRTQEIAKRLSAIPLSFDPGTEFRYGLSADILAAVIEAVSGKRFSEFLRERIWEPLGMKDTSFFVPEEKQARLAKTYSMEKDGLQLYTVNHLGISVDMKRDPAYEAGGAGLTTTIDDWLRFCRMLLNGGALEGVRILTEPMVHFLTHTTITEEQRQGMKGWDTLAGYTYGNLMRNLVEPEHAATLGSRGEYGWDGWLGPYMSVAPEKNLIILVMEQLTGAGTSTHTRRIRNVVYSEI